MNEKGNDNSWKIKVIGVFSQTTSKLTQLLPVDKITQTVAQWFSVSDTQVAEILETIRAELPTTEALLLGKPQAGKSSIVRGLTGVSAEIIGQGFRPHTQHTERYAYPDNDLSLLIFTDTVGLGDINHNTEAIIQELIGDLQREANCPKITSAISKYSLFIGSNLLT
jgi:predicted GTPase